MALLDRAWLDLDMPFEVFRLADLFSAIRAGRGVRSHVTVILDWQRTAGCGSMGKGSMRLLLGFSSIEALK